MPNVRIAVTLDAEALDHVDELVQSAAFPSRSAVIRHAVEELLTRDAKTRLARECAKLDPRFEKRLAEEGLVPSRSSQSD